MLLLSDGVSTGVSAVFPLLGYKFKAIRTLDPKRMLWVASILIPIEFILCIGLIIFLVTDPEPTMFTILFAGLPGLTIFLKLSLGKRITMETEELKVIAISPISIWIEHFLLCSACGLSFLWIAEIQNLALLGPNMFSLIACLCFFSTTVPLLNIASYRIRRQF